LFLHGGAGDGARRASCSRGAPLAFLALLLLWGEAHTVHVADLSSVIGSPIFRRLYLAKSIPLLPALTLQAVLCAAASLGVAVLPLRRGARRPEDHACAACPSSGCCWRWSRSPP